MNVPASQENAPFLPLFGWPSQSASRASGKCIEVFGVPSDSGNGVEAGGRFGPSAVRRASLDLPRPSIVGIDHGDLEAEIYDSADLLEVIRRTVETIAGRQSVPVVLGGDHAISYAAIAALQAAVPLNVLWFDAHTDFCPWSGGEWHNHKQVLTRISGLAHVGRIVQIGHRGMSYVDESRLCSKMVVVTAGAARSIPSERLLELLPADQSVYISVDIDAIDPSRAPGTGHPVPGGLSAELLVALAQVVISNRNVVGLDLMEVNPLLDCGDMTSAVAANIVHQLVSACALAREASGAEQ